MLIITQGDSVVFNLTATDGNGLPVDITGGVLTTYIRGPDGIVVSFPNSQHSIKNQTTNKGQFTLTLATGDTSGLAVGPDREVITKIVLGDDPTIGTTYYHGPAILTVLPPVPIQ